MKISPEQLAALNASTAQQRIDTLCSIVREDNPGIEESELRRRVEAALGAAEEFEFDDDEAIGQLASVTAALGIEFLYEEAVRELLGLELDCTVRMDMLIQAIEAG